MDQKYCSFFNIKIITMKRPYDIPNYCISMVGLKPMVNMGVMAVGRDLRLDCNIMTMIQGKDQSFLRGTPQTYIT